MDALSALEKLKGICSVENVEESGRRGNERGMQRPDCMGPGVHGK